MNPITALADRISDIDLRWTLRDVRANRTMLFPRKLEPRGWVGLRDEAPAITGTGMDGLDAC